MTHRNCHITDTQTRENLEAFARLCQYVAREAAILKVPGAEELGISVSRRIQTLLQVMH